MRPAHGHCPFTDAAQFLSALHAAYRLWAREPDGVLEKLKDLYRLLVVLPYVGKTYTLEDFGQDVYRLDRHYAAAEVDTGLRFRLDQGSTAARKRSNLLIVTSVEGAELTYYGIEFLPGLLLKRGTEGDR